MSEVQLLSGYLEPTNEPYAVAKIAGIKMCESYNRQYGLDYRSVMPTNLYGPGDNYHGQNSHVIPALLKRFHAAKLENSSSVTVWGSGMAKREFLYVDDMASACLMIMSLDHESFKLECPQMSSHVNVGTGIDVTISELVELIAEVVDFKGDVFWDKTKPDGSPRKLLDVSKIKSFGWQASMSLPEGIKIAYREYLKTHKLT